MQKIALTRDYPKNMFSVMNDPVALKTNPKILIIILSKDRNDLLFQCVESIFTHTPKNLTNVSIKIVDTGSSEETLEDIKHVMHNSPARIKVSLLKHGYYNFAKNNNQAFKECNGSKYDYVVFCNNDIKFLNDVLSNMVSVFETKPNVGTVGARLHYGDGTIQHIGVSCTMNGNNAAPGHYALGKAITGSILSGVTEVPGNTAGLLMIETDLFEKFKFSEQYIGCFEDVELNLNVGIIGKSNYCTMDAVAFHYESQTRNDDPQKNQKQLEDLKILSRFIVSHSNNSFIKSKVYSE